MATSRDSTDEATCDRPGGDLADLVDDDHVRHELPADLLDDLAPLSPAAWTVLDRRLRSGTLTARGLHRVRRVARTLADLDGSHGIDEHHVREALEMRMPA